MWTKTDIAIKPNLLMSTIKCGDGGARSLVQTSKQIAFYMLSFL